MNKIEKEEAIHSMKAGNWINETKQIQESLNVLKINDTDDLYTFWDVYQKTRSKFVRNRLFIPVVLIIQAIFISYMFLPIAIREKLAGNDKYLIFLLVLSVVILFCWELANFRFRQFRTRTKDVEKGSALIDQIASAYNLGIYKITKSN